MKSVALKQLLVLSFTAALIFALPSASLASDPPQEEEEKAVFPFEDQQLLGFFDANREISELQKETQEKIEAALMQYNLSSERFGQIGRAAQIGALSGGTFSNEEIEAFNTAAPIVTNIQREQQGMMQALLAEKGLTTQLYQEIIGEFRKNQGLQAYVRDLARDRAIEQAREERRRQRELEAQEEEE